MRSPGAWVFVQVDVNEYHAAVEQHAGVDVVVAAAAERVLNRGISERA